MSSYGFIGTGNMGTALASAICKKTDSKNIYLSKRTEQKAKELATKLNANFSSNTEICEKCKYIFLGVKPQMLDNLTSEIKPIIKKRTDEFYIITMAAGISIENLSNKLDGNYNIIRIMPNTPVLIGEGIILYCTKNNTNVPEEFITAMQFTGVLDKTDENLIDAASAVSGCGPAFCYMFIESLADGAVACGIPRDKALLYACKTLIGSAKMVLQTNEHPGLLKDKVCSPGGSTIAGVKALENSAFRNASMEAVISAYKKTLELGKK